jgi:hydrogenase maturation protease
VGIRFKITDTHNIFMIISHPFPVLCLGYGNPDREDDGVAWHILSRLANRLKIPFPSTVEEFEFHPAGKVDLFYSLQLYPEMVEMAIHYPRLCFIDAHTGAVPEEIHLEILKPAPKSSPFTHHLTPAALLNMASTIYHREPSSVLVSVRGYSFQFSQELSLKTSHLADVATEQILTWIGAS